MCLQHAFKMICLKNVHWLTSGRVPGCADFAGLAMPRGYADHPTPTLTQKVVCVAQISYRISEGPGFRNQAGPLTPTLILKP